MILLVTELAVLEDPAVVDEDDEAAELRFVLAAAAANRNSMERATLCPIAVAGCAEVAWLGHTIVVIVAELGVGRVAAGAL